MSVPKLTDWKRGDDVRSRAHLQEPIDALRYLFNLPNAGVHKIEGGGRQRRGFKFGTITNAGPAAEADFTNEFHWCQLNFIEGGATETANATLKDDKSEIEQTDVKQIISCVYLPDVKAHTHSLRLGCNVVLLPLWESNEDPFLFEIAVPIDQPGTFPVYVEKTGGSNGSTSTAASYTYTVRALNGATMGASVALAKPRPNGTMTFQTGTSGLGLAFYVPDGTNAATLKLWDAGEKETTGTCPP